MTDKTTLAMKKALILKQTVFSEFTDEEAETLAGVLAEKAFHAGDVIVKEGERVDSVFFIVEGNVDIQNKIVQPDYTYITKSVATLGPGQTIGLSESGFYSLTGLRTATVVALNDVLALRLSVAAFNGFALSNSRVSEVMRSHATAILSGKSFE